MTTQHSNCWFQSLMPVSPLVLVGILWSLLGQSPAHAANYAIALTDTGFAPSMTNIDEGDTVTFTGRPLPIHPPLSLTLPLTYTDGIVQIKNPASVPGADVCGVTSDALDSEFEANDANEFTGPLRRGVSGIFALGPEDAGEGYYETTDALCSTLPVAAPEVMVEIEQVAASGHIYRLCQMAIDPNGSVTAGDLDGDGDEIPAPNGTNLVLTSTWDNPDIAGVVVRMNWTDLFTDTDNGNGTHTLTYNLAKLDTEMNNAAKRGKQVLLEVMAGAGTPQWVFQDYLPDTTFTVPAGSGIVPQSIVPVWTKDYGSDNNEQPESCGYRKRMGSPNDPAYRDAVLRMIELVIRHIRKDSRHFMALGSLKVTGLNFLTGEMRLPKRCLDTTVLGQENCLCNTAIWATPLGEVVGATEQNPAGRYGEDVVGGGYTETGMQEFVELVENKIYTETQGKKTMIYMLIQDGFPRVLDADNYYAEPVSVGAGFPGANDQTVEALNNGQAGYFVDLVYQNLTEGKLFAAQHAGLQPLPQDTVDESGAPFPECPQHQALTLNASSNKYAAEVRAPGTYSSVLSDTHYGSSTSHCPNRWATREGYEGQLSGFQTNNLTGVNTIDHVDSTLWNGTVNSNMIFWEGYERLLWRILRTKGSGPFAPPLSELGYYPNHNGALPGTEDQYRKNLSQWGQELHRRRDVIASQNPGSPHMADPHPRNYVFGFNQDLNAGEVKSYYFINPATCTGAGSYGTITVTGN